MDWKKKATIIVATLLMIVAIPSNAAKYKVLFANSSDIKIGSHKAKRGLIFDEKEQIVWTTDKQAMQVQNLTTRRIEAITARQLKQLKARTLTDYLFTKSHLSTREYGNDFIAVDTVCYALDTLYLDAGKDYNRNISSMLIVTGKETSKSVSIKKTYDQRQYIIPRSALESANDGLISIDILETDKQRNWTYYVYRALHVVLLPLQM